MTTVILVIHIMICAAMVTLVLLQRSEGGALGIGGGGGGGGFMSGRGTANLLTRATAVLAAAFFATSIMLTIIAQRSSAPTSILDGANTQRAPIENNQPSSGLPDLKPSVPKLPEGPRVPSSQ
ncbi:MAG: preprotein translocase subunit SecG [Methyloligellaceae bacterium]